MSKKNEHIARIIGRFEGHELPAHYLGYFDCFNQQLFYEAHDVLEAMWLPFRHAPDGNFYKGLIQLAGAFVHVQKNRPRPATALLRLARANLANYPDLHHSLDVAGVLVLIEEWHERLSPMETTIRIFDSITPPSLSLFHVNAGGTEMRFGKRAR